MAEWLGLVLEFLCSGSTWCLPRTTVLVCVRHVLLDWPASACPLKMLPEVKVWKYVGKYLIEKRELFRVGKGG